MVVRSVASSIHRFPGAPFMVRLDEPQLNTSCANLVAIHVLNEKNRPESTVPKFLFEGFVVQVI